jgi:hypothetical protein
VPRQLRRLDEKSGTPTGQYEDFMTGGPAGLGAQPVLPRVRTFLTKTGSQLKFNVAICKILEGECNEPAKVARAIDDAAKNALTNRKAATTS